MKVALKRCALPLLGAVFAYLARGLTLYAFRRAFEGWNLNAATYVYAPAWARFLADNAATAANLVYAAVFSAALIYLCPRAVKTFSVKHALFLPAGMAFASACVGVLLLFGSVRISRMRFVASPFGCALAFLYALSVCVLYALLLCAWLSEHVKRQWAGLLISAALRAALSVPDMGGAHAVGMLNAFALGAGMYALYKKTKSIWPEALFGAGIFAAEALVFGYSETGRIYPVSEAFWTGGGAGLKGSGIFCVLFAAVSAGCIVYKKLSAHGDGIERGEKRAE